MLLTAELRILCGVQVGMMDTSSMVMEALLLLPLLLHPQVRFGCVSFCSYGFPCPCGIKFASFALHFPNQSGKQSGLQWLAKHHILPRTANTWTSNAAAAILSSMV